MNSESERTIARLSFDQRNAGRPSVHIEPLPPLPPARLILAQVRSHVIQRGPHRQVVFALGKRGRVRSNAGFRSLVVQRRKPGYIKYRERKSFLVLLGYATLTQPTKSQLDNSPCLC